MRREGKKRGARIASAVVNIFSFAPAEHLRASDLSLKAYT
jgi:hypothetical protein